jgi:RpiR family glv operon transcriptional regulator
MGLGLRAYFVEADYQITAIQDTLLSDDLLIALSYSGQDTKLINTLERLFLVKKPFLLSITRADNNALQYMSDVNFYIFAEEITRHGINLTSRVSMLVILELLVYSIID